MSETRAVPKQDVVGFAKLRKIDQDVFLELLSESNKIEVIEDE